MPMDVKTHVALGLDRPTPMEVNGRSNHDIGPSLNHPGDAPYHPCPEAFPDNRSHEAPRRAHRLDSVAHLPRHGSRPLRLHAGQPRHEYALPH